MTRTRLLVACCLLATLVAACSRDDSTESSSTTTSAKATACDGTELRATDVGVTADTITIEVMADVGNPLAPGLFQGNVDAIKGFADYVNSTGGLACRDLVVRTWDSNLNPSEAKNGQIDACQNALAMVGSNALFNPDVSAATSCKDRAGAATGLPDMPGTANDPAQLCSPTTFMAAPVVQRCPIAQSGPRPFTANAGVGRWYAKKFPGSHGIYLVPGDLPTTIQSATYIIRGLELGGLKFDAKLKVSGRTEQSGYTPIIQVMRSVNANFVVDGLTDTAMIRLRKEAKAQGYDAVKAWGCIPSCYSRAFRQAGPDVDGTYVTLGHLPFEEADTNEDLAAFVKFVGQDKIDGFGALAWHSADLFRQAADDVVEAEGPNGLTRAALLDALGKVTTFDARGWGAKKTDLHGGSPCFVVVQIEGGVFHRVHPATRGTMDCDPKNTVSFELDPAVASTSFR